MQVQRCPIQLTPSNVPSPTINVTHRPTRIIPQQYLLVQKRGEASRQIDRLDVGLSTLRKTVRGLLPVYLCMCAVMRVHLF